MSAIEQVTDFNIKALLGNNDRYEIPVYQRNYAWGSTEIEQLLQDITDYAHRNPGKNYYIGTLVVAHTAGDETTFQTVDGQQRLTTLSILSAALRNEFKVAGMEWLIGPNLKYASRVKSQLAMDAVFKGEFADQEIDPAIKEAYHICIRELPKKAEDNKISIDDFARYLYEKVMIMRVGLPVKINLNHYFEIMNSRGEQLEKHEVLKARLMDRFNSIPDITKRALFEQSFDLIWEACSNMEKYVQYGFTVKQRNLIFGQNDWNNLTVANFEEFSESLASTFTEGGKGGQLSIDEITIGTGKKITGPQADDSPDRFNTVVNFPNFLLHVLRVQTRDNDVSLDDKRLIDIFDDQLKASGDQLAFVQTFIFNLLRCKFLFDQYIIKREFIANTDRWALKKMKWYDKGGSGYGGYVGTFGGQDTDSDQSDNRQIIMLLAMFHVSVPAMVYKNWLHAALLYLFENTEITAPQYIAYLEHIAKAFVFDRFLSPVDKEFHLMIFADQGPVTRDEAAIDWSKLRYGSIKNNLVFNFTDYLIWQRDRTTKRSIATYEFTSRSSVEHYYPQNHMNAKVEKINNEYLHSFGNLCLISHEKNSRLSNFSPMAKKEFYPENKPIDSPKQYLMMQRLTWGIAEISEHGAEMKELLINNRNSTYQPNNAEPQAARWFRQYRNNNRIKLCQALLGFGDFLLPLSSGRYSFFDFDHNRRHEAHQRFEAFVEEYQPKSIQAVIDDHLANEELKNNWRYLFIQHPWLIKFCANGYICYRETGKHWIIELLQGEKRTKNKTRELLLELLRSHLHDNHNINLKPWDHNFYIDIVLADDGRYAIDNDEPGELYIRFWNNEGSEICYELHKQDDTHGNARSVKMLQDFGWEKDGGIYRLPGQYYLAKLNGDASADADQVVKGFKKLLKQGFGIQL